MPVSGLQGPRAGIHPVRRSDGEAGRRAACARPLPNRRLPSTPVPPKRALLAPQRRLAGRHEPLMWGAGVCRAMERHSAPLQTRQPTNYRWAVIPGHHMGPGYNTCMWQPETMRQSPPMTLHSGAISPGCLRPTHQVSAGNEAREREGVLRSLSPSQNFPAPSTSPS